MLILDNSGNLIIKQSCRPLAIERKGNSSVVVGIDESSLADD